MSYTCTGDAATQHYKDTVVCASDAKQTSMSCAHVSALLSSCCKAMAAHLQRFLLRLGRLCRAHVLCALALLLLLHSDMQGCAMMKQTCSSACFVRCTAALSGQVRVWRRRVAHRGCAGAYGGRQPGCTCVKQLTHRCAARLCAVVIALKAMLTRKKCTLPASGTVDNVRMCRQTHLRRGWLAHRDTVLHAGR